MGVLIMGIKQRIALIAGLILILSAMFFFQKSIIDEFSFNPERVELYFNKESEILSAILAEEEYINERYTIAYEEMENNSDNSAFIISILKDSNDEDEFFKDKFLDYLKLKIPYISEETLSITDYSSNNRILAEWHKGTKLFIASLLFILIVIIFIRRVKNIKNHVKEELKIHYIKEMIKLRISEILEEAIKLVVLMFGGIFLLQWIIKFQFNIPGKYLPAYDIFDFEFYQNLSNTTKLALSSYGYLFDSTLNKVRLLSLGFFILGIITLLIIIRTFNNKLLRGRD